MRRGRRGKYALDRIEREEVIEVADGFSILLIRGRSRAIECSACGLLSYNVNDIEQRYCGQCKKFHQDRAPMNPLHAALLAALAILALVAAAIARAARRARRERLAMRLHVIRVYSRDRSPQPRDYAGHD